jgi:hypothetical protein
LTTSCELIQIISYSTRKYPTKGTKILNPLNAWL